MLALEMIILKEFTTGTVEVVAEDLFKATTVSLFQYANAS